MTYRARVRELAEATTAMRRREDAAPRLCEEVRRLSALRLRFDDIRSPGGVAIASYTRPVVVPTAPAHFEIRCMEPRCDGWHDLTHPILRALHGGEAAFVGTSECRGFVGDIACNRVLAYLGDARYRG